jgi:hypothetical protein
MGPLSIDNKEAIDIIYVAGYITTNMIDPIRIPLAVWVPYDTHRLVYGSNDCVRQLATIDGQYHLSKSWRSAIKFDHQKGTIIVRHDTDSVLAPKDLLIIGDGEIG